MDTIYLITSGEYSDYKVHGAFVDESDARAIAELAQSHIHDVDVEPLPLCGPGERTLTLRERWTAWAHVGPDGVLQGEIQHDPRPRMVIDVSTSPEVDATPSAAGGTVFVTANADTLQGALKAVGDKIADLAAQHHEAPGGQP